MGFPEGDNPLSPPANVSLGPGGDDFSTGLVTNNTGTIRTLSEWVSGGGGDFLPTAGGTMFGSVTFAAGSLAIPSGSLEVGGSTTLADTTVSSLTVTGNATIDGGSLTVNGTGTTTINSGPLVVNGGSILLSSGVLTVEGNENLTGTLAVTGDITLNGSHLAAVPATGVVYSNGTILSDLVIGANLALSGNTLSASNSGTGTVTGIIVGQGMTGGGSSGDVSIGIQPRMIPFPIIGAPLPNAQTYPVTVTQDGTLLSSGAHGIVLTPPSSTMTLTVGKISSSGTVTTSGTVTIATSGALTIPSFSLAMVAGDSAFMESQSSADSTGGNLCITWPYVVT